MQIRLTLPFILLLMFFGQKTLGQQTGKVETQGDYYGFGIASWLAQHRNESVGNPIAISASNDFKFEKFSAGFNIDLMVNYSNEPLNIKYGSGVVQIRDYYGFQGTFELGGEVWRKERLMLETICGVGYGYFNYYYNIDDDIRVQKASFVVNPGLSVRYLYKKNRFVQIKAQYNVANYKLDDVVSTDFHGNYFTLKLVFGSFVRENPAEQ